ncbi:MAG TPA: VOC family protein [Dehalococcoidia bacterium]|nr:VOC family protein [Dehalococcoidia bacterium]
MQEAPRLVFEGVIGYGTGDAEEAAHFFEHTLGLEAAGEEGGLRLYRLGEELTLAVDATGSYAGQPPYLLFSTPDLNAAAEHFVARGCQLRELDWGPAGSGFLARAPEGHTVCVVDAAVLG